MATSGNMGHNKLSTNAPIKITTADSIPIDLIGWFSIGKNQFMNTRTGSKEVMMNFRMKTESVVAIAHTEVKRVDARKRPGQK